jgi:hypothetical protein
MAWLKGFASSIWSFVCLVSVVGSRIIVVAVLMTSTANANVNFVTITNLAPDLLYLLPASSGKLTVTISEPAETGGIDVLVYSTGDIVVPGHVIVLEGETMASISVTAGGMVGEGLVTAVLGLSYATTRIIIVEALPPMPIPGAVLLLLLD